jgi:hypothetical protein
MSRAPVLTNARFRDDRERIVAAAVELVEARVPYESCLRDYVAVPVEAHDGDGSRLLDAARAAIASWLDVPPDAFDVEVAA